MPIKEKSKSEESEMEEEYIEPFTVATYTATSRGAEKNARKYLFGWSMDHHGIILYRALSKAKTTLLEYNLLWKNT
ncbi:hypothetical protein bsdtb5_26460 [Anaeromicropila herbilytica]|uniref:Uncharacterized protein n=2 Tax=Anaeromicropila herbilytica TaxID=2785025 RepID=A0A7R7EMI5_9FIRM|nr:hypothetical protein bsdtb5_26460 [Anaeromicropila herbilytica]